MKRHMISIGAAVVTLAFGLLASPSFAGRTEPGSFLKYEVSNPSELSSQVLNMPDVAHRYATYYKQSPTAVAQSFRGLHLVRLSKDLRTTVHYISVKGRISSKTKVLAAGRLVFADSNNKPVLDARCGNPLTDDLPVTADDVVTKSVVEETPVSGQIAAAPADVQVAEVAQATTIPGTEPVFTEVLAQPAEVFTGATTAAPVAGAATTTAVEAAPVVIAGGGGGGVGFLAAVPLLLLGGAGGGGGGGGTPVVPEPSAVITLATGLIACAGAAIKARR